MLGILLFLLLAYLLSNFFYYEPLKGEYEKGGFWAAVNFSLGLFIHQIGMLLVAIFTFFTGEP